MIVADDCTRECLASIADAALSGARVARKLATLRCANACRFAAGVTFFSKEILPRCIVQHRICQQPLQAGVFVLEPLQSLDPADMHAAYFDFHVWTVASLTP